jgi:hypothetical protein
MQPARHQRKAGCDAKNSVPKPLKNVITRPARNVVTERHHQIEFQCAFFSVSILFCGETKKWNREKAKKRAIFTRNKSFRAFFAAP